MVSTMTFDQLAETYERHLRQGGSDVAASAAREDLAKFLEEAGGEDTVLQRRVRIILVSAGFDAQITTTVLWLNELYGLDIRCLRLTPYRVDGRLLLDIQQVISLPEAEEFLVRLRRRESAARAAEAAVSGADWTQYTVNTPTGRTEPLRKRRAVLALLQGIHQAGVPAEILATAAPLDSSRFTGISAETDLSPPSLRPTPLRPTTNIGGSSRPRSTIKNQRGFCPRCGVRTPRQHSTLFSSWRLCRDSATKSPAPSATRFTTNRRRTSGGGKRRVHCN